MAKAIKAFISGCAGKVLTTDEVDFFRREQPWGLILFQRNCESPGQLKALTDAFREAVGRKDAPVLIDQEGGRVQRMSPGVNPVWRKYPAAALFGKAHEVNPLRALRAARHSGRLMAEDLAAGGITVDCLPVLDVPVEGAHSVIGDRAYHVTPEVSLCLARAHVDGLMAGGVLPVMKHIPGHGRSTVDSHKELPVVDAKRDVLEASDFRSFAGFADCPMAMTAHVVYRAIDPKFPATQSAKVIKSVIRKQLAFNGLLMSDDLSMKALGGTFAEKTAASLKAGCDLVLYCHGVFNEMVEVAAAAPLLKGKAMARAKAALKQRREPAAFDRTQAEDDVAFVLAFAASS